MKEFVFRFHCEKQYYLALRLINLCEHFGLSYTFDIEDVGDEHSVESLNIVIIVRGNRNVF